MSSNKTAKPVLDRVLAAASPGVGTGEIFDTVIIGSGVSGLCSAILMANSGRRVLVLEAGPRSMPLMRGFSRQGLNFDVGFHYAGGTETGGTLRDYCRLFGIYSRLSFVPLRRDCCELFRFYRKKGEKGEACADIAMPYGRSNVAAAMEEYFPGEGGKVALFLREVEKEYNHSPFITFEGDEPVMPGDGRSLSEVLAAHGFPENLRAVLAARCMLFGSAPRLASFSDYSLVASSFFDSAGTISGGGRAVCAALTDRLAEMAVAIRCSSAVVGMDSGYVPGVRSRRVLRGLHLADGSFIPCGECIYTGHPRNLPSLLGPGVLRPSFEAHLTNLTETPEPFMLFGSAHGDFLDGRIIYLCDEEARREMAEGLNFSPNNIYLSGLELGGSANGCRPVMACASLPERWRSDAEADYQAWKKSTTARLARLIRELCPEIKDFTPLDAASPRTMQRWIHGSTGSVYGMQRRHSQLPLFPHTRVRGLALAGQSIILPGVLGAMVSAVAAVGIFLGYNSLFGELRQCAKLG